jgi:hypothetical protein
MTTTTKRIAVIITHGMGEQIPMATIDGFVEAAWVVNKSAQWTPPDDEKPDDIWFMPDATAGLRELRRITTRWTRSIADPKVKAPRVDFFEFYWADLAEGTTVHEVWDWLRTLLWRPPSRVPRGVMGAWLLLWAVAIAIAILSLLALVPWTNGWLRAGFAAAASVVAYAMQYVVSPYAGDVARYVRADPRNIAMRANIRDRGLKLLQDIHGRGIYQRIIVVAHSLGTIVAYDLICLLWAERDRALAVSERTPAFKKLRAVEEAAHALKHATTEADIKAARQAYREAQRALRLAMRSGGEDGTDPPRKLEEEWLISDFVTLGSPLTHAQFLLASDQTDLKSKIDRQLFPTNWPQFEIVQTEQRDKINDREPPPPKDIAGPEGGLFSYFIGPPGKWSLHAAAPFAAVRWTNIFDSHRCIFKGDIISGPLASVFGQGIRDIALKDLRGQSRVFSHTLYWSITGDKDKADKLPNIATLHKAIDLLDRPDGVIWASAADQGDGPAAKA